MDATVAEDEEVGEAPDGSHPTKHDGEPLLLEGNDDRVPPVIAGDCEINVGQGAISEVQVHLMTEGV
ncbi:hypothetical protein AU195_18260 [Mycobacterium sp. IS-1496]|uniref:hypothetical protein n=1 Tax=Mycobacterium sp. IS-1496 TaxID=1772284 RepID=UPI0007415405|nr:hypothetical protein [Mycobacterium sp. IS-1496]KUI37592.1 hypothetical protein AU195_18260 [Mycobacterium sp. IS-1496]